jgi:hypothetical protein
MFENQYWEKKKERKKEISELKTSPYLKKKEKMP